MTAQHTARAAQELHNKRCSWGLLALLSLELGGGVIVQPLPEIAAACLGLEADLPEIASMWIAQTRGLTDFVCERDQSSLAVRLRGRYL